MKKISQAIKESGIKSYLICGSCKETFINDLLLANTIQCPNGCKTVLLAMAEPENLEEKIKKLEEELNPGIRPKKRSHRYKPGKKM